MRQLWKYKLFPSWRFVIAAAVWAVCVTLIVAATKAPFWTLYLAPLSAAPLMIHEIRNLGARYERLQAQKKPLADRVSQGRRTV